MRERGTCVAIIRTIFRDLSKDRINERGAPFSFDGRQVISLSLCFLDVGHILSRMCRLVGVVRRLFHRSRLVNGKLKRR